MVFRKFVAKLMTLQNQLDSTIHTVQLLRNSLVTSLDIPPIQVPLRDRLPLPSKQAVNSIANQISDKPRTVGTNSVCIMDGFSDEANSALGEPFRGKARRPTRVPW